ncbi:TerB family tellurite resistance protein [Reichenbachiella agarivorans]|uniref:TerB family tellurite resistance protein n=1 Tax=Reichenbachiella agarivorans TaxID=2979464 RepID=A0ABY6CUU5_9BACT|nr:TerB family tellurite resistance protein [Reichenbachiella agarivorans]UXP34114.1 TerB family tellurite resistance protein [Reichenbachiella agarivorans]
MTDQALPTEYQRLLLRTVFAFMICDTHIAQDELDFIRQKASEKHFFGSLNIEDELAELIDHVNRRGIDFFDDYFKRVKRVSMTDDQELQLIDAAIRTVQADDKITQEEINFLKILRVLLNVSNEKILTAFPKIGPDFVDQDKFTEIYFKELYANYVKLTEMPVFDISDVKDITASTKIE